MNKLRLFIIAFAVCMSTVCCSSIKSVNKETPVAGVQTKMQSGKAKLITRKIPLRDFKEIECYWITTLKYKQSSDYSVTLTTTEQGHELLNVYVENGTLHMRSKGKLELKKGMVTLEVSCPSPRRIMCVGEVNAELSDINTDEFTLTVGAMSGVKAGRIKATNIEIEKYGEANLTCGSVASTNNVKISSSGMGSLSMSDIKGGKIEMEKYGSANLTCGSVSATSDVKISSSGMGSLSMSDIRGGKIEMEKYGSANLTCGSVSATSNVKISSSGMGLLSVSDIRGGKVEIEKYGSADFKSGNIVSSDAVNISCSGIGMLNINDVNAADVKINASGAADVKCGNVSGTTLTVNQSGLGNTVIAFKGQQVDVSNAGARSMDIGVDCDKLRIAQSGTSKITVTGTADDVKIEGQGATSVDCRKLNKY